MSAPPAGPRPRVLFVTESFHPVLGGGETHIRELGRRLARLGWSATVVTRRSEAAWARREVVDGIQVVRVPPPGPARRGKYLMLPGATAALAREATRHDVVVVRGTRVLALPALLVARARCRPLVLQPEVNGELSGEVYTWGTPLEKGPLGSLVRFAARIRNRLLRDAEACVAMSRLIRDEMRTAGFPPERIHHIPHGVDTTRFRPAEAGERASLREKLGLPAAATVVSCVGRLLRGKGLETLVDAFARTDRGDAHLVLVGSGEGQILSVESELRSRVRERGLAGRVSFPGRVDRVEDYLRASDLFAFPSVFEALGIALLEASACGLPAVASRTGGIVDVVEDGVSGLLVPPGDTEALAAALTKLLGASRIREEMGRRSRQVAVGRFELEDSLARYRGLFAELAGRVRGPAPASR